MRKSLQPSTLQRAHTAIDTLIDQTLYLLYVQICFEILPVDDDDDVHLQSCFFHTLFCTMSHLLTSSRTKQLCWYLQARTVDYLGCCNWYENGMNMKVFVLCLGYKLSSAPVPCAGCSEPPSTLQLANGPPPSVCDARRCSIYSRTSSPVGDGTHAEPEL